MEKREVTLEDLQQLAAALAQKIPDTDCPECCDRGVVYQYVERSAKLYNDEWEWACLSSAIIRHYRAKKSEPSKQG